MNLTYQFTRLLVSNFKACFIFYRDILGFTPIYGTEDEVYADFDCGPVNISLFDKYLMNKAIGNEGLPVSSQEQDKVCLVFAVENVDLVCQQLYERGVPIVSYPTDRSDWGIRTAHFRDPDGNLIEINQPL
jgi:lactoylglutathione lyase